MVLHQTKPFRAAPDVPASLVELLQKMLVFDPVMRLSWHEFFSNPIVRLGHASMLEFMSSSRKSEPEVEGSLVKRIQQLEAELASERAENAKYRRLLEEKMIEMERLQRQHERELYDRDVKIDSLTLNVLSAETDRIRIRAP